MPVPDIRGADTGPVLAAIRSRRVTRAFTSQRVPEEALRLVLEAARWSPSGGNRRLNVYVVVRETRRLRQLRAVAPGILGHPSAVIVVCIDASRLEELGMDDRLQNSAYVDVGTATQNMLLAAHELGLGACPVMSFHRGAVQILLDLPEAVSPVLMVALGYPDPAASAAPRPRLRLPRLDDIVLWESYGG